MNIEWTETAFKNLSKIKSKHYSKEETAEYKERLVLEIEKAILEIGNLFPSRNYKNRYYVKVNPYIISFKHYPSKGVYSIIAFQHEKQNKRF